MVPPSFTTEETSMSPDVPPEPTPNHRTRRVGGPRVILVGVLLVLAVTAFIVSRILHFSGPGPDPNTIPQRPDTEQTP